MRDENHICTLGDYSKPSHESYRNTIELPIGNNVVPLRSDTICGSHDTQYCMKDPEQAFDEYATSRTNEARDARLSKFEADFKQEQSEMTNKIDTVLKAITNRIARALPSDMVKNPKLNASSLLSAVNKVTTSCQICSGSHDTQYCMKDPEQAFDEYATSRTDEARGKWYTFKAKQNNLDGTYNPSWRSHPNL
nr:MAK10-like protein [Tanacetum cinerariifolium]